VLSVSWTRNPRMVICQLEAFRARSLNAPPDYKLSSFTFLIFLGKTINSSLKLGSVVFGSNFLILVEVLILTLGGKDFFYLLLQLQAT